MVELLDYWKDHLNGAAELVLPSDYSWVRGRSIVEAELQTGLSQDLSKCLLQLSLETGAVPFTLILAAFSVIMARHSGSTDIVLASSSPNDNPILLRFQVGLDMSFKRLVALIQQTEEEALLNEISFSELDTHLDETMRALLRIRFFNAIDASPETLASIRSDASCDLTVFVSQSKTLRRLLPIDLQLVYNAALFSESRIQEMLEQIQLVLIKAASQPEIQIGQVSLITEKALSVLPQPIADLEWNRFEGAITDIFAKHAQQTPEKCCVVESLNQIETQWSYQSIFHGMNVLSNYLIECGVQREDVVALYSYRGVDLVVAIMGVLQAGATFCVIDPAYPPARQVVYLSVAQPKGIIVLKKAGTLHEEVNQYIEESLSVRCFIPELELSSDNLTGGLTKNGHDVLFHLLEKKNIRPQIPIGPDSIGTLSFTSGSTGIPKGVRGRHFSLTHFYPWMAVEFGLSDQDRFTMLSGIAHDPIQRDIFTPLFLGAQIRIPQAEDIGTPGKLAEWMALNGITVTHLTPAMGQLLSANASAKIPSLKNAFFVGDVLTKRDVLRLQNLAENVNVINMYGTTETQRAVSYFRIPSQKNHPGYLESIKDIIPAGKGMQNVQLLVVNPNNQLCGVGELGEIYVRSGGLAEGYLQLPEVTLSKFLANPFNPHPMSLSNDPLYLGPRDRVYRSGDLGRYCADGSVECTGRADDQVKIRGFRIELKEIDTHMSQHANVRENVTLVRRDVFEEKTLVSYFVPLTATEDIRALVKDIREFLNEKLPSYAVPKVFVPLTKMPLTPNGKIDKNALPFPDTALLGNEEELDDSKLTSIQKSIRDLWSGLLNRPSTSIGLQDNFFDLGGHSILATRLIFDIRQHLAVDVPLGILFQSPTLKSLSDEIEHLRGLNLAGEAVSESNALGMKKAKAFTRSGSELTLGDKDVLDYANEVNLEMKQWKIPSNLPTFKFPIKEREPSVVVFVTGVTGFLGAFILSALTKRYPNAKLLCHVRAKTKEEGLRRILDNCERHLVQVKEEQIVPVCGDLGLPRLGLNQIEWDQLCEVVDMIIHNGALVHWIYPYSKLKAANVGGTLETLTLASTHHLKPLYFVSSTSVLDTPSYVERQGVVMESDDLSRSAKGLHSGYAQSKWVAEKIIIKARDLGVKACIIRPGYIVGDSKTGVGNSDDFLWRLVKGCIQLGQVPKIANVVNMAPVDYVASCIVAVMGQEQNLNRPVYQIWHPYRIRFDDLFSSISSQYSVQSIEYIHWRTALMELTLKSNDHALYPLLHFVLDDLPTSTKAPDLDHTNTLWACQEEIKHAGWNGLTLACPNVKDLLPLYLGYFVHVGFLNESKTRLELPQWQALKREINSRTGN